MTITSTNFPIEGEYRILWSPTARFDEGKTIVLKEGTSPRGNYAVVESFAVPDAPSGMYYVGFIRLGRDDPTIFSFTVVPRLRVQPISGSPGTTVTVYGNGFPAGDTGSLTFDSKPTDVNITAAQTGSFTIDFVIPNAPANDHQLSAKSSKLSTSVPPTTLVIVPAITVDPKLPPQAGATVTVTGHGFAAKGMVSIKYNDLTMTSSPATDDTGNFSYSFTLPQGSDNGYKFVATDQVGNTVTLNIAATGDKPATSPPSSPPPSTPQPPTSPETPKPGNVVTGKIIVSKPAAVEPKGQRFGLFGTQPVNFIWSQVSAPGGVTYTLEVADDYKFSTVKPDTRATGLTQTNYTLKLEPGTYYWRVKAVGASGNESEWSNSLYAFTVGLLPTWALAIAGIVYIVIFYLLLRLFLRRRNQRPSYY